jgi:hypothetical protein
MYMKKIKILFLLSCMATCAASRAADNDPSEVLLSLIGMKPEQATEAQVTTLLGKPSRTEESKKQLVWHYNVGNNDLTVYWDSRALTLQKYSFTIAPTEKKGLWDSRLVRNLRMGQTDITQAIKALGTPKEMMVKEISQELHYSYENTVLNLFFRNGTLVNYTLY